MNSDSKFCVDGSWTYDILSTFTDSTNTISRFIQLLGAHNLGPENLNMMVELLQTRRISIEHNVFNAHSFSYIEYCQRNHSMNGMIFEANFDLNGSNNR